MKGKKGYSMVELLIALAITGIVMSVVILLLSYGARSMNRTQARVALQDQAKDAMKHMTSYIMEATDVQWDEAAKQLVLQKDKYGADGMIASTETYAYMQVSSFSGASDAIEGGSLHFQKDPSSGFLAQMDNFLTDKVDDFSCEIKKDAKSGRKVVHLTLYMKDNYSEFQCDKDIAMRNQ